MTVIFKARHGLGSLCAWLIGGVFSVLGANAPADAATHCPAFGQRLPNVTVALCEATGLRASGASSVRGVPLYVRDVLPAPTSPGAASASDGAAKPAAQVAAQRRILVVGAIHGDELSAAALAFHWRQLASQGVANTGVPGATNLAHTTWRFIPALNPDGLFALPPTRVNARGVDLNRNFPTPNWLSETKKYWEGHTKKDPRRWPGPTPLSEPESRFLHEQMASFKPQVIVAIHAPYGVLDFDGPSVPPSKLGRLYLDQVGIFPGSLGNYGGVHRGVPVVTVELPSALRTPLDSEMRLMWVDLLRWVNEKVPLQTPATAASGAPAQRVAQTGSPSDAGAGQVSRGNPRLPKPTTP